jgi:hypothetical protein
MDSAFIFPAELTAPNELRGQTPRRTLFSGSGVQMALSAALLLALAVAGVVWMSESASRRTERNAELRRSGVQTSGNITSLQSSASPEPTVTYTFTIHGSAFTGQASVPPQFAHTLSRAGTLPILYLPANPAINHPAAWTLSSNRAMLVAPLIAAMLGLLLFLPLGVEWRLAAEGAPVLAVVSKCARGRSGFLVHYEFRLEDGTRIAGRGWCKNNQLQGEGIWVLCSPKNPRRNLPYPLTYCRVLS